MKKKIVIGVTGASGSIYALKLFEKLDTLKDSISECGVVFSGSAETVLEYELQKKKHDITSYPIYDNTDFFAPFASGSANYDTMIVCPCTMGTVGKIAHGFANDLLTRAADVMLKERKTLVLVVREMPYNLIHIENFKLLASAGAIICPASPSFYSKPQSIDDLVETVINKVLHLAGFSLKSYEWGEEKP
ncbi:MAG: UbiX family flavin prenyltransferase [bacterium]